MNPNSPSFVLPRATRSSAIRIVAPSAVASAPPSPEKPLKTAPKRPPKCRNILIHGYCKNENKGCIYDHSDASGQASTSQSSSPIALHSTLPVNLSAPVFIPKGPPSNADISPEISTVATQPPLFAYAPDPFQQAPAAPELDADGALANGMQDMTMDSSLYTTDDMQAQMYAQGMYLDSHDVTQGYYPHPESTFIHQPLNYHLYTQLPYVSYNQPPPTTRAPSHRFFMSDTLREDLQRRSEAIYSLAPPRNYNPIVEKPLPEELHVYHSLTPLEGNDREKRKWFAGWPSTVYKATSRTDGAIVVLRRIEGFRLVQEAAFVVIETWRKMQHPNIVSIREAFTTRAFGDYSLVFAYDFHPTAQTLYSTHFTAGNSNGNGNSNGIGTGLLFGPNGTQRSQNYRHNRAHNPRDANGQTQHPHVEEAVMWSYVVQIANAMKEVHERGLAVRTLDPSKIIVTGKNRIRLNCCGIFDVLAYDPRVQNTEALQQEDLVSFGKLIFALCCNNLSAMNNLPKAIEILSRHYSPEMKNIALFLISKPAPNKLIDRLLEMLGPKLLVELNSVQNYSDQLEGEMMSELENGRLVRLLTKFGFINERPDFHHENRWSETGDRYIISLFRDYVFHQVDERQNPVVNLTHVITCLNKLDAGTDERIMLVSRDEQTCLVVSYKEIKACIDSAFSELARAGGR